MFGLPVGGLVWQVFESTRSQNNNLLGSETFTQSHLLNSYLPSLVHIFFVITDSSLSNGVRKRRFFLESNWNMDLQYEQETLVAAISVFYSLNRFIKSFVVFFSVIHVTFCPFSKSNSSEYIIVMVAIVLVPSCALPNSAPMRIAKICRQRACLTLFCVFDRK